MGGYLGLVPVLLFEVGFIVVVGLLSRGRIRLLGLVAGVLWLLSTLLNTFLLPFLYTEMDLPLALMSGLFGLTHWVALVLVAIALVIGGRAEAARHRDVSQPDPTSPQSWGEQQPSQQWGQQQQPPWGQQQQPQPWNQPNPGQQPPSQH